MLGNNSKYSIGLALNRPTPEDDLTLVIYGLKGLSTPQVDIDKHIE